MICTTALETRLASAFKAYDICGRVPQDVDPDIANAVGQSFLMRR